MKMARMIPENVSGFVEDEQEEEEEEQEEEEEEFRLYSCVNNRIDTHCVEFGSDDASSQSDKFFKLSVNLRPFMDLLIESFPKKQTIGCLFEKCSDQSDVTIQEVVEFV